ncbi:MAG TPA: hypothetical protein VGI40_20160 [Pirellulaceae bacterium]
MSGVKKRVESVWFMSKCFENLVQRGVQHMDVFGDDIRQGTIFGLIPNLFDRVEVGGIRRQPFHVKPRGAAVQQLSGSRAMSTQAIPHDNERAPQMLMHLAHEADDIFRAGVVIQEFVVRWTPIVGQVLGLVKVRPTAREDPSQVSRGRGATDTYRVRKAVS